MIFVAASATFVDSPDETAEEPSADVINIASSNMAALRWRMTDSGGSSSHTVTAPSRI
jgi:hypothetical protein